MQRELLNNGCHIVRDEDSAFLEWNDMTIPLGDIETFINDLINLDPLETEESDRDRYENALIEKTQINSEI